MAKIKKGDTVLVIAGKDKGITGKVLDLDPRRILIEGVNRVQRHHQGDYRRPWRKSRRHRAR